MTDPFSLAQCFGYLAFVLGTSAFLQRRDGRLKALNSAQSFVYAIHYTLLGNPAAASTALVSALRSYLAIRSRSLLLATVLVAINVLAGFLVGASGIGWLPVTAGATATLALFTLTGLPLRLVLFCCTLAWLVINWVSGSIGGLALETFIGLANATTMIRMWLDARRKRA